MMVLHWILSGGILHIVCLALQLGIASLNICGDGQLMHSDYKTGERACCYNRLCRPGFYPVICNVNDPNSTSCRHCPKQTFQPEATDSVDMRHCEAKTTCYANQVARNVKSKTKDTVCKCKRGYCNSSGLVKFPHGRLPRCIKKKCNEGFCLAQNCTCGPCIEELKDDRERKVKSCNSSSLFSCREKRESTASEPSTTSPEVYLGIAYGLHPNGNSSFTPESEITQPSSNNAVSDLTGSFQTWQIIIIVILFVLLMIAMVVAIVLKTRKCPSTASYSEHLPNSCSSSSGDSQLEKGETIESTKPICTQEQTSMLQWDKQRENLEISNIQAVALTRNDGGEGSSRDIIAPESTMRTFPVKSDAHVPSLSMNLGDRKKLINNLCVLVRDLLLCPHLWAVLLSNGTVTGEIKNKIEGKGNTDSEKNDLLIEYLQKRNCHAFETFIASLIMTKQDHLAVILDKELTVKLKDSFPTDELLLKHVSDLSEPVLAP